METEICSETEIRNLIQRLEQRIKELEIQNKELSLSKENAEDTLRESEERYKKAQEVAHVGSWEYNIKNNTFWGSDEGKRVYGFNLLSDEFSAEEVMKCVLDGPRVNQALIDLIKNNTPYNIEFEIIPLNSTEKRTINSIAELIKDENGEAVKVSGVMLDITHRKDIEQSLIESEKKFKSLVRDMQVGVLLQGPNSEIILSNPKALELLGINESQLLGKTSFDPDWNVIHEDGSLFPGNTHPVPQAIATLQPVRDVIMGVYRPSENDRVWLKVDAEPQFNDNGTLKQVVCSFINITKRKIAEEKLKENESILTELNADKNRFISILSHDLRSPFNALLGLSEILTSNLRTFDIDEIENLVNLINKSAHNTFNLLEDILLWTQTQSGKIPFNPQKLFLRIICNEVFEQLRTVYNTKNIKVNYFETDEISVFADRDMLKTVLRNLVSNAIKFTNPGGKIDIRTLNTNSGIVLSVEDNGIGMNPDRLSKLFDISNTHSSEGTGSESGTGLGLIICKEFVEKHGGRIWVESAEGKGSKVKFILSISEKG
jgi:two-component system, sensor histidine kinase and response regulator